MLIAPDHRSARGALHRRAERFFVAVATTFFVLSAMAASAQDRKAIMHACAGDVKRLCAGIQPGGGRIKACMKKKMAQVSAPCINSVLQVIAAGKEP
jgi:hypothetical protein